MYHSFDALSIICRLRESFQFISLTKNGKFITNSIVIGNCLLLVQVLDDEVLKSLDAALDGLDVKPCKE